MARFIPEDGSSSFPRRHIGKGKITRMRIRPGMEIVVSDMTYELPMKLHIMEACRLFELSYCVSGEIYCEFTTAFRKHYGCNPGDYVKQLQQSDLRQSMEQEDHNR